jgi:uncharacterized protein YqgC (DUF456 family)
MVVGLVGIVVPVLPGLLLCYGGVLVWAIFADAGWGKWLVLAICTGWAIVGTVVKYAWPGRRMKKAGIPNWSILAGVGVGIVGFFVIPFVGLPLGFVAGIWLAEWQRHNDPKLAWPSTVEALKATGLGMLIEFGAGFLVAMTWVAGLLLT